jgi:hypothetical protein
MLSVQLIQLIERHAESLAREVVADLLSNEHTPAFRNLPKAELEPRILALYQHLGNCLSGCDEEAIKDEYEAWGRTRRRQGIPASEIAYALIITKQHLRRYIREHGVVPSGERVPKAEVVPLELYSIQQLNYAVGDFFDKALYYLLRGYELQARGKKAAAD